MVMSIYFICFIMNSRRSPEYAKLAISILVSFIRELSVLIRCLEARIFYWFLFGKFIRTVLEFSNSVVLLFLRSDILFEFSIQTVTTFARVFGLGLYLTSSVTI